MNRHFEDSRYYLGRTVETAAKGVRHELRPLEERVREMTGREAEPEPDRVERLQYKLREFETKAEGEAKRAVSEARARVRSYRA